MRQLGDALTNSERCGSIWAHYASVTRTLGMAHQHLRPVSYRSVRESTSTICAVYEVLKPLLIKLRVFRFRRDQDRNVCVGIFPWRQEILIGRLGLGGVALHGVSTSETEMRQYADGFIQNNATMVDDFLKLCYRLWALTFGNSVIFERVAGNEVLQRHTIQELHGNEGTAVLVANVVHSADIGMVQGRGSLRLALKTAEDLGFSGYFVGRNFKATKRWSRVSSAL